MLRATLPCALSGASTPWLVNVAWDFYALVLNVPYTLCLFAFTFL